MSVELPKLLSQRDNLRLRQNAVAGAEVAFRRAKGARERHDARVALQHNRRSLKALQEIMDAKH